MRGNWTCVLIGYSFQYWCFTRSYWKATEKRCCNILVHSFTRNPWEGLFSCYQYLGPCSCAPDSALEWITLTSELKTICRDFIFCGLPKLTTIQQLSSILTEFKTFSKSTWMGGNKSKEREGESKKETSKRQRDLLSNQYMCRTTALYLMV